VNDRRHRLAVTSALTLVTCLTAASFDALFTGDEAGRRLVLTAIVAHAVAALLRLSRIRWPFALAAMSAATLIALGLTHHRTTVRWGFVPTRSTLQALVDDARVVWAEFPTALVPVPADGPFAVTATAAVILVAFAADTFAHRVGGRLEALAPAAVTFVVVGAIADDAQRPVGIALWLAVALGALLVLRSGTTPTITSRFTGVSLVVVAVALAAVLTPELPGYGERALIDTRRAPGEASGRISPLVDIRGRLVERSDTVLFTVGAPRSAYWRLTGLSRFDGSVWSTGDERPERSAPADAPTAALRHDIDVRALRGETVPAAFAPVAAAIVDTTGAPLADAPSLLYAPGPDALLLPGGRLDRDVRIEVISRTPDVTPADLTAADARRPPSSRDLELPDDFPDDLRTLAADIAVGTNPYERSLALQRWFRDTFTYELDVPAGHGYDAMRAFIERRTGYCEQFAGTYAAFMRAIGVPARVAVGFTPGDIGPGGRFVVRGRHAHAWPEVWFDGMGWIAFEPTPGRGVPGAEAWTGVAAQQADPLPDTATDSTAVPPTSDPVETTTPPVTEPSVASGAGGGSATGTTGSTPPTTIVAVPRVPAGNDDRTPVIVLVGLFLVALWLLAAPPAVTAFVRRRRHSTAARIDGAWKVATRALDATGARVAPGSTPLEHARVAARLTGLDPSSLSELAHLTTAATYSGRDPDERSARRAETLRDYIVTATTPMTPTSIRIRRRLDPLEMIRLS
jgi:transglutaminase-like putative cysteine protease